MVIMTHVIIPTESAKETGKRYIGMSPLPDYLNLRGPYIYVVEGEGIHSIDIFELERAKMSDALEFIYNRHIPFFGIPGYTDSVKVCLEGEEAVKMLGLV